MLSIDDINNLQSENEQLKRKLNIAEYFIKCIAEKRTGNIPFCKQAEKALLMIEGIK